MASTAQDIASLGTILSLWAHPDDESFTAAGILATAAAQGQTVICVTATQGEQGVQDETRWPAERLGEIRAQELATALKILGISSHYWLNYRDGNCAKVKDSEIIPRIKQFITKYQPDTILTFGPEGLTGHPDHCCVSRWALAAADGTQCKVYGAVQLKETYDKAFKEMDEKLNIFFNIESPPLKNENECDICLSLDDKLLEQKFQALAAMPSQTETMLSSFSDQTLRAAFGTEAFVRLK